MLFDKITSRIKKLCYGLDPEYVDAAAITLKVRGSFETRGAGGVGEQRTGPARRGPGLGRS